MPNPDEDLFDKAEAGGTLTKQPADDLLAPLCGESGLWEGKRGTSQPAQHSILINHQLLAVQLFLQQLSFDL